MGMSAKYLSVSEFAARFGVYRSVVKYWIYQGYLQAEKRFRDGIGGRGFDYRIPASEADRFVPPHKKAGYKARPGPVRA